MKGDSFLLINHKNAMDTFDIHTFAQVKTNLFLMLGAKENHTSLKSQINKIISSVLSIDYSFIANEDQLDIIYRVISLYYKKAGFNINNQSYCDELCRRLASNDFNTELTLKSPLMDTLAMVLSYGFINLQIQYNKGLDYPFLMSLMTDMRQTNIGIIKSYSEKINKNGKSNCKGSDLSSLGHNGKSKEVYAISNELLLLLNIFSSIKTVNIHMDNFSEQLLLSLLLLLLNSEWLFLDVLTISYNTSCPTIHNELSNSFKNDLSLHRRRKNSLQKKSFWKKNSEENHSSNEWVQLTDASSRYHTFFIMLPLISHYLLHMPHMQNLCIVMPDAYRTEVSDALKSGGIHIDLASFHFLELYLPFQYLVSFTIEFNCLELSSFDIILGIINNNINLKHLSISLFTKEEECYYYTSIYKTATRENFPLSLFSSSSSSHKEEVDPDLYPMDNSFSDSSLLENSQLIESFESNLEHLFLLLLTKKTLNSIHIELDIPGIIGNNEQYYYVVIKFLFNLFIVLNNNQIKHLTEVKLISPALRLDNRKYPLIEQFFDRIDLFDKNIKLTSMAIQFQVLALPNLSNALSKHLQYIFIGDLDLDSLKGFIAFYQREDFAKESRLKTLILSLSSTLFDYEVFKGEAIALIKGRFPKDLKEVGLYCSCAIKAVDLMALMEMTNGNQIEKYIFQIKLLSLSEYNKINYERYYFYDCRYNLNYAKNKWIILQVLHSMRLMNRKLFALIMIMLNKGFVIQKMKKRKTIEILFK